MDYQVDRWINHVMHAHPLLASVVVEFSTWGVTLFGVLAVGLWLLSPAGDTVWKRAATSGLAAAVVGLLANQAISHIWDRARPYQAHPNIVPLLSKSGDPSFPSDHATAAFSIAFGVFFVSRRAGWFFLAFATVVASSRVLAGMHYPTDVLASIVVSIGAGYLCARVLMQPILAPLIRLVARMTDPILVRVAYLEPVRRTLLSAGVRSVVVAIICVAVGVRIVAGVHAHLFDEMELAVIAAWIAVSLVAVRISGTRFWPDRTLAGSSRAST